MRLRSMGPFANAFMVIGLSMLFMGWGHSGHYKINQNSSLSFNEQLGQFLQWTNLLAYHASDADERKSVDPDEAPRHYIDIDNYPEFLAAGRIPQTFDSVLALHGYGFVIDQGILPWATMTAYDSLKSSFERKDWEKAILFASDLGHYVGDGHMPLHITRNYNGQYSGNDGIHSRYESTMINAFGAGILYDGYAISFVEDVDQYIFDYLYLNYVFVDSVLASDDYARSISSNTSSDAYKEALWDRSQGYTIPLFSRASHSLAELIFTAWVEAGSPLISPESVSEIMPARIARLEPNSPNPFDGSTRISFTLNRGSQVSLRVCDLSGRPLVTLVDGQKDKGGHEIKWTPADLPKGVYLIVLSVPSGGTQVRKALYR